MYNIQLEEYISAPRVCHADMILAAHYFGAWAPDDHCGTGAGFDDLHDYPERTPLMGYYDESNPEVCDWEIKWALEHGIRCFIHCWYRHRGSMEEGRVQKELLRNGHVLRDTLPLARFRDQFLFAIMFENSHSHTNPDDFLKTLLPFWMENYFTSGNYLIIDNKPVLFVYGGAIVEDMGGVEACGQVLDEAREYAKNYGFDGIYFALESFEGIKIPFETAMAAGFDFRFGYRSGFGNYEADPPAEKIIAKQVGILKDNLAKDPMRFTATPSCFRDPDPRRERGGNYKETNWYLYPDDYRVLLREMKKVLDGLPDGAMGKKLMLLDCWNEWDEGHYISPNHEFGFQYLQAIREELTHRDNLPDYRMPRDVGLGSYEGQWEVPDLANVPKNRKG